MSDGPRVLFVSKPIAPPWHDGSKNLVRDVASHLTHARPTVMTVPGAPSIGARVVMDPVYRDGGRFAPSLLANARVLDRLVRGDPLDVWSFVFAPNPASSSAAQLAKRTRRVTGWRGAVVQTIASAPRSFAGVGRWIFGDHVVVLSEWTRGRLLGAGVRCELVVIPPCAAAPRAVAPAEIQAFRDRFALGDGPIVLYPGDYEVSRGAKTVARAVPRLVRAIPDLRVVFACRAKTKGAAQAQTVIEGALAKAGLAAQTRHVGEVDEMAVLLAAASAVAFPVDDLYGKVDLPLVLLEALACGVPIVAVRGGPLEAIASARFVEPGDDAELARELLVLLESPRRAQEAVAAGRALYAARFTPSAVASRYDDLYASAAAAAGRAQRA